MSDKIYDELQAVKPADFPDANPIELAVGPVKYQVTAIFPDAVGDDVDLIVKYQSADVSNSAKTYQENQTVAKALLAKYPELKQAFHGLWVYANSPGHSPYAIELPMDQIH